MWFICGLGNTGKKYQSTRHNLGSNFIESFVNQNHLNIYKKDKIYELYKLTIDNNKCLLCKPKTYMNLSGVAVSNVINFYKIPLSKVIIVHDDLDLEVGKIKIKIGGGNGGHNGLEDIDKSVGKNYKRIRIGIGHPGSKNLVSDYVLNKFLTEERKIIDNKIKLLTLNFPLIFKGDNHLLNKLSLIQ